MVLSVVVKKTMPYTIKARKAGKNEFSEWDDRPEGVSYRVQGEISRGQLLNFELPYGASEPEAGEIVDFEIHNNVSLQDICNGYIPVKAITETF